MKVLIAAASAETHQMNRKILLSGCSVVFALLLCEAAGRWLVPSKYRLSQEHVTRDQNANFSPPIHAADPEIGWVLTPATVKSHPVGTLSNPAPAEVYSISHGERLTSLQERSGPLVIVTGASYTFGQGVNDEDTSPWLLQERLPGSHVVNVAAMAYGTDQALLAAEREAVRFPDESRVVVLGFDDSQIDRNRCTERWLSTLYPLGKPLFVRTGDEVQYQGLLKFWSFGNTVDKLVDHSTVMSRAFNVFFDHIHRIESHEGGTRLTVALITTFARRFQSRGIKLVVVMLPYKWDYVPQAQADRSYIVDQLRAANVPTMLMDIPRLPDGKIDPHKFMVGTHPNRRYNSMLADQLTQFLSDQDKVGVKSLLGRDKPSPRRKSVEVSENPDGKLRSN